MYVCWQRNEAEGPSKGPGNCTGETHQKQWNSAPAISRVCQWPQPSQEVYTNISYNK